MLFDSFYATAVYDIMKDDPIFGVKIFTAKSDEDRYNLVTPVLSKLSFPCQIPDHLKKEKCSEESAKLRDAGNRFYLKGMTHSALRAYTESIARAPSDSKSLSLAFGNRSAVLKRMDLLDACIADIDLSLAMGYERYADDATSADKLYARKDDCLYELDKRAAAIEKERQEGCEEDGDLGMAGLSLEEKEKLPELSYEANPELPSASDCLALCHDEKHGRHIVATRDINPGDVLMIDRPYVSFLEPDCFYTHCSHCFKRCPRLMPCETCTWAMFCSEGCRLSAAPHHSLECELLPKLLTWDMGELSYLVVRIVAMEGQDKILAFLNNLPGNQDPRTKGFTQGKLASNFQSLYHLEHNSKRRSASDLLKRCILSFCLVKVIDLPPKFGGLVVRLLQILATNSSVISENFKTLSGVESDKMVGSALFIESAMLTHSCNANVTKVSTDNIEVLYATQPVKEGGLVTISYGWSFMYFPKTKRQERCMTRYQFHCTCEACVEDWPLGAQPPWPLLPRAFRSKADRHACDRAVLKVSDLWEAVQTDQELGAKDAARVGRHLVAMSSLGATKCFHYHVYLAAFEHHLARKGSRYQETL